MSSLSVYVCTRTSVAKTNLVLEAERGPWVRDWRGQCGGSFLHFHHWQKHMLCRSINYMQLDHVRNLGKSTRDRIYFLCIFFCVSSLMFSSYGSSRRNGCSVPAVFSTKASMTSCSVAQGICRT